MDFGPLLENPRAQWKHPAIIDYLKGNTAIRTKDWRYIQYDEDRKGEELYDLISDLNEWMNLIDSHRELATPLRSWLPKDYAEEVATKGAYDFDSVELLMEEEGIEMRLSGMVFTPGHANKFAQVVAIGPLVRFAFSSLLPEEFEAVT